MTGLETIRLLAGRRDSGRWLGLRDHAETYGPPERALDGPDLIGRLERSGLRGRGGGSFPTGRKLRAVAGGRRRAIVVVNGCEGEPASAKDLLLLERLPHLVLDGAALAASAVGAREALVCIPAGADRARVALRGGLHERAVARSDRISFRVVPVPDRYVASEESALVQHLNGGPALPTFVPPRPFQRGVGGRPTLVQNAETLAHVALIARRGSEWFRELGTPDDPGTTLVTVSGAVDAPGIYEIPLGVALGRLLALARPSAPTRAVLLGGYFGSWVSSEHAHDVPLAHHGLRERGAALGCGVVIVLPAGACGLCETAAVLDYLAAESAGQCGPCVFGLRAIADRTVELGEGFAPPGTVEQLRRWAQEIEGRGACHHPDGAIRLLRSTLDVFAEEAARHQRGMRCRPGPGRGLLMVPSRSREAA